MVSIEKILEKASEEEAKARQSVNVENKQIDLLYDLAHLSAFDLNPLDLESIKSDKRENYLLNLTRDNTQLVINKIWELETKRVDNVITAILPTPVYNLPRAKPIPKPKPLTKWEAFAKSKGIVKKKKERMVWDDVVQQWKPRYGYRSIGQQKQENQWLIEVPDQADPTTDYFAKESEERSERIAKNELKRLRNLSRSQKLRLPGTSGILPNIDLKKDDLQHARSIARKSNASMGKFFDVETKNGQDNKDPGKRRKFDSNFEKDLTEEKRKNIDLAEKVLAGQKRPLDDDNIEKQASKSLKKLTNRMKKLKAEKQEERKMNEKKTDRKNQKIKGKKPGSKFGGKNRKRGRKK